jgi:hypothetical protein
MLWRIMSERTRQPGNLLTAIGRYDTVWLALASMLFFGYLLARGSFLLDNDLYFHIRIADLMRRQGWVSRLPWMSQAIHADRYVDYHFLFHWLLVPFVVIARTPVAAARAATIVFSGFSVAAFVYLLRDRGVRARWFWVLFLLLSSPIFAGRLLFGRGVTLCLGLYFLYFVALARRRNGWICGLSAVVVWTYPAFPLLIVTASTHVLATALHEHRWRFSSLLWTCAGVACALVLHPAFPHQFRGYWLELVVHSMRPAGLEPIGEWLPADPRVTRVAVMLPVAACAVGVMTDDGADPLRRTWLVLSLLFLAAVSLALKPIEYLVPVVALYVAGVSWKNMDERLRRVATLAILGALLIWGLPQIHKRVEAQYALNDPRQEFDAADWLASNTPEGSLVMLSWGEFPEFFYRNIHNRYLFGLNPVYAYGHDPRRYIETRRYFDGTSEDPSAVSRSIGAAYAVLNRVQNARTIEQLRAVGAPVLYANEEFVIFSR